MFVIKCWPLVLGTAEVFLRVSQNMQLMLGEILGKTSLFFILLGRREDQIVKLKGKNTLKKEKGSNQKKKQLKFLLKSKRILPLYLLNSHYNYLW